MFEYVYQLFFRFFNYSCVAGSVFQSADHRTWPTSMRVQRVLAVDAERYSKMRWLCMDTPETSHHAPRLLCQENRAFAEILSCDILKYSLCLSIM